MARLKEMLRPEHREAILCIKEHYHRRGQLRDGMSVLIYKGVIDNGIRTIDEFERYLSGDEAEHSRLDGG